MNNQKTKMPVLFIGHGTPMNAIENNIFSNNWKKLADKIPNPRAIVCISAHWETPGTYVSSTEHPETIYDFFGFPEELYTVKYLCPGSSSLADDICVILKDFDVQKDTARGLDHGAWCFLRHMYPHAQIPVIQISLDYNADMKDHYNLAKKLLPLREEGVLFAGSGNMVHNLRLARSGERGFNDEGYYDWALKLNNIIKEKIFSGDHAALVNYQRLDQEARLAVPTEEHYIPLIYSLALAYDKENISLFNDTIVAGSLSMTSLFIGDQYEEK